MICIEKYFYWKRVSLFRSHSLRDFTYNQLSPSFATPNDKYKSKYLTAYKLVKMNGTQASNLHQNVAI